MTEVCRSHDKCVFLLFMASTFAEKEQWLLAGARRELSLQFKLIYIKFNLSGVE